MVAPLPRACGCSCRSRAGGWAGHAAHVERAVALAARLADACARAGWTVANDPALAVVCLVPPAGARPVREIVARVLASGGAWVSAAVFEGRDVVRACVTHGETSAADMEAVAARWTMPALSARNENRSAAACGPGHLCHMPQRWSWPARLARKRRSRLAGFCPRSA